MLLFIEAFQYHFALFFGTAAAIAVYEAFQ